MISKMAAVKASKSSQLAAFVLIAVNLCALGVWTLMFALGVWTVVAPDSLAAAAAQTLHHDSIKTLAARETLTPQLGAALVLLAALLLLLSGMAVCGALTRSPFLLMMYALLGILLLLLECALIYYFSSYFIEKGLQRQDGQWSHALRLAFRCCEYNASVPEPSSPAAPLPWSCCGAARLTNCSLARLYSNNCQVVITNWIQRYQTAIYASLAVLHILLSSCSLARRRRVLPSRSYS